MEISAYISFYSSYIVVKKFIDKSLSVRLRCVLIFVILVYQRVYGGPVLELHQLQTLKLLNTMTTTLLDHSNRKHIDDYVLLAEWKKIKITQFIIRIQIIIFSLCSTTKNNTYRTKFCLTMNNMFQIKMDHIGGKFNVSRTITIGQVLKSYIFLSNYKRKKYGFVRKC